MTQCGACLAAEANPLSGQIEVDCRTCAVRSVSDAPDWLRETYYEKIRDGTRRAAFRADVEAEATKRSVRVGKAIAAQMTKAGAGALADRADEERR